MIGWFKQLDGILRGEATRPENLEDGTIRTDLIGMCVMIIVLGAIYGLCMSVFGFMVAPGGAATDAAEATGAATASDSGTALRVIATMIKVPALFFLTLLVTFPSLYVFNALVGSRLSMSSVLRLIIASLAVSLAVLASFGPIVAFFSFTTETYSFMVVLTVIVFTVAGVLGLMFLLRTLQRLVAIQFPRQPQLEAVPTSNDDEPMIPAAIDRVKNQPATPPVKFVFNVWILVFGLVGAQMAWVMRPFIGSPDEPYAVFRARESNFFESVWHHLSSLF